MQSTVSKIYTFNISTKYKKFKKQRYEEGSELAVHLRFSSTIKRRKKNSLLSYTIIHLNKIKSFSNKVLYFNNSM